MTISRSPIYNLGAVLNATGMQADVLRAWERRYDLPQPQRTPGGHRLYSDYDIATLKWLRTRQAEGLSISRAVKLWKEITNSGKDPLSNYMSGSAPEDSSFIGGNQLEMLRDEWVSACLAFDTLQAGQILSQAFALYPLETVCFEILQNGVREIGDLWHKNQATAQQEHHTTTLVVRHIETLISAAPAPTRDQTILVGCPQGEWHHFPILLLNLLLRRRGLKVVNLGANIPLEKMTTTVESIRPDLIILSAQQLGTAASLRAAALLFQKAGILAAYGGLIFNRIPELRDRIPAFYLGDRLDLAVDRVEQLLTSPETLSFDTSVDPSYLQAARMFRTHLPQIGSGLEQGLSGKGLSGEYMADVNAFFATGLLSALELGSLRYLEPDLDWVKKLLSDRNIPPGSLPMYLNTYRDAVDQELRNNGSLITGWIDSYLSQHDS